MHNLDNQSAGLLQSVDQPNAFVQWNPNPNPLNTFWRQPNPYNQYSTGVTITTGSYVLSTSMPRYNKYFKGDKLVFEIDVAGYDKSDITIELVSNELTVTANKGENDETKEYLIQGIHYNSFTFEQIITEYVDLNSIKAKYKHGLLKISFNMLEIKKVEIE